LHPSNQTVVFSTLYDGTLLEQFGGMGGLRPHDVVRMQNEQGCDACDGGYRGRLVLPEALVIDNHMRTLIFEGQPSRELAASARAHQQPDLWSSGLRAVVAGQTTFDEVAERLPAPPDVEIFGNHFTQPRENRLLSVYPKTRQAKGA